MYSKETGLSVAYKRLAQRARIVQSFFSSLPHPSMSLDEQGSISRSLSGLISVRSHPGDQSSGAGTPKVAAFPNLSAVVAANMNGAQHHTSQAYCRRSAPLHVQQNLGCQSLMSITGATGNVSTSYADRAPQSGIRADQGVCKLGTAAIPIVRPLPVVQATVGAIGDGRKRSVLGVSRNRFLFLFYYRFLRSCCKLYTL